MKTTIVTPDSGLGGLVQATNVAAFPTVGNVNFIYLDKSSATKDIYYWNAATSTYVKMST